VYLPDAPCRLSFGKYATMSVRWSPGLAAGGRDCMVTVLHWQGTRASEEWCKRCRFGAQLTELRVWLGINGNACV